MTAVCIKPACGPACCDCNNTISQKDAWKYMKRYAFLRLRDLNTIKSGGVFAGMTPDNIVLNGADLDDAIDRQIEAEGATSCPATPPKAHQLTMCLT